MRRRQDDEAEAHARERVRRVLPPPGWVPEPAADGAGQDQSPGAGADLLPEDGWAPAPPKPLVSSVGPPTAPTAPSAPAPNGAPPPAPSAGPPPVSTDVAERSWTPPADEGPAGLLPVTLRGGRLDPGRRGALALLLVVVLAAAAAAAVLHRGRPQEVAVPAVEQSGEPLPGAEEPPPPGGELVVSVAGTVAAPGLVRLPTGSRVDDALRAAGGLLPGTDPGLLNLARKLVDGEQVLVGVGPPPEAPGGGAGGGAGPLDLNAATVEDLDALPGIGPVLAERIVDWRQENGPFRSVDQLREVPGIGEAKYAVLEPEVRV